MKRNLWVVGLLTITMCVLSVGTYAQDEKQQETPKIKKVVMYKHGVGYFERRGTVDGDATVTLSFKASQMKDLITSLFAVDTNGGKVTNISYDSKDPLAKQLENILISVPDGSALTTFISQLKGAKVEVKIGDETTKGSVIGIEPITQKTGETITTNYKLVLLRDDGNIQPVNLLEVTTMKILDDPLQQDLKRMLDIYLKSKYADRKQVAINVTGNGKRELLVGYVVETPIWKTSYRMLFDDDKATLQGWAIVDNPTDEDWDGVQLSLVAGNPMSFVMDLYTPYYPQRQHIGLQALLPGSLGVELADDAKGDGGRYRGEYEKKLEDTIQTGKAYGGRKAKGAYDARPAEAAGEGAAWNYGGGAGGYAPPSSIAKLLSNSLESIAQGTSVGELFSYNIKTPVSIPRGKAALVPIVADKVDGERVLYFKRAVTSKPMNAYYFKNATPLTLEAGPVTFFEESTSLGEGLLKKELKTGMKEMIPYAIENGCSVESTANYQAKPVHKVTLANGVLTSTYYYIMESTYKVKNQTKEDYVLYLDHPKNGGYKLTDDSTKAEEELDNDYRFKVKVGSNKTEEFKVQERTEVSNTVYIAQMSPEQIEVYLTQPQLNAKAKKFLEEVVKVKSEETKLRREYNALDKEKRQLESDEGRYRSNISVLGSSPKERTLREKYVEQLDKLDNRLGELRVSMQEMEGSIRELETKLAEMVQEFKD